MREAGSWLRDPQVLLIKNTCAEILVQMDCKAGGRHGYASRMADAPGDMGNKSFQMHDERAVAHAEC